MTDVPEVVAQIVRDETGAGSDLAAATELNNLSGWDSVSMAGVLMALEDRFDIAIDRDQLDQVRTVGDLVSLVGSGGEK